MKDFQEFLSEMSIAALPRRRSRQQRGGGSFFRRKY
jgi:hypothetical protein